MCHELAITRRRKRNMKKLFLLTCLIIASTGLLTAATSSELYTLVVPTELSILEVEGGAQGAPGSNVAWFELDTTNMTTSFDVGLSGTYLWFKQTETTLLNVFTDGGFTVDDNELDLNFSGNFSFKSYSLDLGPMKGFYAAGSTISLPFIKIPWNSAFRMWLEFSPYGEIGIGRYYNIFTIKRIQTIMDHLGLVPSEEAIRNVAKIMYKQYERLNLFTDDTSQNHISYYQDIASAMGIPDRAIDIVLTSESQRYKFEIQRYNSLIYGWEAKAKLTPTLRYNKDTTSSQITFLGTLSFIGDYGSFLIDDKLHLGAHGDISLKFGSTSTPQFWVVAGISEKVTYLPENYRMWVDSSLAVEYDTSKTTDKFTLDVDAMLRYMINPNFTVYGGAGYGTGSDTVSVFAGGNIRIW